ncbi:MAG: hypothetical protein SGILL_000015 [Bacillariaceae sp.]
MGYTYQVFQAAAFLALPWAFCYGFTSLPTDTSMSRNPIFNTHMIKNPLQGILDVLASPSITGISSENRSCKARDLVSSLVKEEKCFATESGAKALGNACALDVVYEDCSEPKPFIGREAVTNHMLNKVKQRRGKGDLRIDMISDGNSACGFGWTLVATDGVLEGLRGTTFVELNSNGEVSYIREIPEPLYKPGDLTVELLKALTKDAQPKPPKPYTSKTPKVANELARYLFLDVQGSDINEAMRFFSRDIVYRDFNYEEPLRSPDEVKQFISDFSFPGITFSPQRFDDGIDSTCFTWEVQIEGQDASIKGMSFYQLDPDSRLVKYVRDVPESAVKPPPLGRLASLLQPGLGVFSGVPAGGRPGGL